LKLKYVVTEPGLRLFIKKKKKKKNGTWFTLKEGDGVEEAENVFPYQSDESFRIYVNKCWCS